MALLRPPLRKDAAEETHIETLTQVILDTLAGAAGITAKRTLLLD